MTAEKNMPIVIHKYIGIRCNIVKEEYIKVKCLLPACVYSLWGGGGGPQIFRHGLPNIENATNIHE